MDTAGDTGESSKTGRERPEREIPGIAAAYVAREGGVLESLDLTRGPWDPAHQHAGPPSAAIARAIEAAAAGHGLDHLARLTVNLLRPVPIGELDIRVQEDYIGRNAGHFSAQLLAGGRECARVTALALRQVDVPVPAGTPGHPLPQPPRPPGMCPVAHMPVFGEQIGYDDLVEIRVVRGRLFDGPTCAWFRLRYPLVDGEEPSACQRVAVAADSGNGISAVLDFSRYVFINSDLTINLLRPPRGQWICLDARTAFGETGSGLAESALYDEQGLLGRATQSLLLRAREP
ncbi:MAG: thioesterase family protein [Burkholderiaceae bacterium]